MNKKITFMMLIFISKTLSNQSDEKRGLENQFPNSFVNPRNNIQNIFLKDYSQNIFLKNFEKNRFKNKYTPIKNHEENPEVINNPQTTQKESLEKNHNPVRPKIFPGIKNL